MPGGDRTGPMGFGPMTGRAAGFCAGYPAPGYINFLPGRSSRGWRRGRGGGRGWRYWYHATGLPGWARFGHLPAWGGIPPGTYSEPYPGYGAVAYPPQEVTPQQEIDALKGQAEYFEGALDGIRKHIAELEASAAEKK
jgi:hypothetical protein